MKKNILFILLSFVIFSSSAMQNKKEFVFSDHWKTVDKLADNQLPESALKEVELIYEEALKQHNFNETVKAFIHKMRFTLEKDGDNAPQVVKEFEAFSAGDFTPEQKALLHSMTAELYMMYYTSQQYIINQRTQIEEYIPEDISRWSKNIFYNKIKEEIALSLQHTQLLQQADLKQFSELIEKSKYNHGLQTTLFDFLSQRGIQILNQAGNAAAVKNPLNSKAYFSSINDFIKLELDSLYSDSPQNQIIHIYQQLLKFHLMQLTANPAGQLSKSGRFKGTLDLILINLQRLDYVRNESENVEAGDLYFRALQQLEKQYSGSEYAVEIIERIARFYLGQVYAAPEPDNSYKRLAYNAAADGIKRFPKYRRINILKNIQEEITQKSVFANYNDVVKPGNELVFNITTANIHALQIDIYRVEADAKEYYLFMQNDRHAGQAYPKRKLIDTKSISITPDPDFGTVQTEFSMKAGTYGIYEFSLYEKENNKKAEQAGGTFTVSNFAYIQRQNQTKTGEIYVLDRVTGKAEEGVNVSINHYSWDKNKYKITEIAASKTDITGLLRIPAAKQPQLYFFEKGADRFFSSVSSSYYYERNTNKQPEQLNMFTDRSIYRPGQTVYFKGIAYSPDLKEVIKNKEYEVKLLDANWKEVSVKKFRTNEFGSFSGEFILPASGLNGSYQLSSGSFNTSFKVEEYKRPSFEVEIEKPETEVLFGKQVTFKGSVKAYSGYSVSGAAIKYSIVRRPHRLFWWRHYPEKIVSAGSTSSNADGNFEISFIPEKIKEKNPLFKEQFYTYTLHVDASDPRGETQQGVQTISVGDKSLFIIAAVPPKADKSQHLKIPVRTETLNGTRKNSSLTYSIYQLENTDIYQEKLANDIKLKETAQIASGEFSTRNDSLELDVRTYASGQYKIVFKTFDVHGNEVTSESTFILYSRDDSRPPVKSYVWLVSGSEQFDSGEAARIIFGTSASDTHVLYELMQGQKVLESRWIIFDNETKQFTIPYKESYGEGINAMFTFIKDEQTFSRTIQIKRKAEDKTLTPELAVFRDKLKPGEKAEWTVAVPQAKTGKMLAELMIGMYDASLDAVYPHRWVFNPLSISVLSSPSWSGYGLQQSYAYGSYDTEHYPVEDITTDELNWFGLNLSRYMYKRHPLMRMSGSRTAPKDADINAVLAEASVESPAGAGADMQNTVLELVADDSAAEMSESPVQVRKNFNETAFFYPQLRTGKDGNVTFTFTVPESLTRWNVKMLAHTPDLHYGHNEVQVTTQKELMVQLNMPRIVHRSDKLVLAAGITNLTENQLPVKVQFELIDPETEKPIKIKDSTPRTITLKANENKTVQWEITEFSDYELVVCKVTARAGKFSDGEQHYLPVLPDKVLITESMPVTVRGNETHSFTFESPADKHARKETKSLVVEFASNPAWYAVQALPALSAPINENAVDYFATFYVNSLAAHIANANPKLAQTFDRWKQSGRSREALLSNLDKNTELKNVLLEETPWVMQAQNETEQKRQIALLFDLNQQKNQSRQYMDKLISLQQSSGAFEWFNGMGSSRYLTQTILLGMARYQKMTGSPLPDQDWINKAVSYIDAQITKDFETFRKNNKDGKDRNAIGNLQWFYLHVRSEYPDIPIAETAQEAFDFYTKQAYRYWKSASLYGKAAAAVIAGRNGNKQSALDILASLKENALKTEEYGMYWADNKAGYLWSERPVTVQTAMIEAFAEITGDKTDINEMKIWLLRQKQTQRWDSPISTVDAVYALLHYGTDWISNDGNVEIRLGSTPLKPKDKEAGTGYFKETFEPEEIRAGMNKITISRTGKGIGWGAVYKQYFSDIDKVQASGGPLAISKKLFVVKTENGRTAMIPADQTNIKKGDKIITRLEITTDRSLEFAVLKDLRAACLEPVDQLSGYERKGNAGYYKTSKDASTQFFFTHLEKGTYVFEYESWANNSGDFASGTASIQCLYAPEFVSYAAAGRIKVE